MERENAQNAIHIQLVCIPFQPLAGRGWHNRAEPAGIVAGAEKAERTAVGQHAGEIRKNQSPAINDIGRSDNVVAGAVIRIQLHDVGTAKAEDETSI